MPSHGLPSQAKVAKGQACQGYVMGYVKADACRGYAIGYQGMPRAANGVGGNAKAIPWVEKA